MLALRWLATSTPPMETGILLLSRYALFHLSFGLAIDYLQMEQADIDTYATKYPLITGIFLDEAASEAAKLPVYTQIYNHIKSKNYVHAILNPGVVPDQGYMAVSFRPIQYL